MNKFVTAAIKEVYDCHTLIEEWFHGTGDATPQLLEQLLAKFSPDFSMINPAGLLLNYTNLQNFLTGMCGARPNVKIKVTSPQVIMAREDYCVLKYEEFQYMSEEILHRIATATFISDGKGGVLWQHLHETWLNGQ